MAAGDLYSSQINYHVNGLPCSNTFVWEEGSETGEEDTCADVNAAIAADLLPSFLLIWSHETKLCNIKTWGIDDTKPPAMILFPDSIGDVSTSASVANKNMKFLLRQVTYSVRTNGELRVAGIPEADTTGNTYIGLINRAAPLAALIFKLTNGIESPVGDNATFHLQIASSGLEAQAAGPIPSYQPVVSVEVAPRVYSDRRRTSRHQSVFATL